MIKYKLENGKLLSSLDIVGITNPSPRTIREHGFTKDYVVTLEPECGILQKKYSFYAESNDKIILKWAIEDLTPQEINKLYTDLIVEQIREKYSIDDELALHRQRSEKFSEFYDYSCYCEECKKKVKEYLGM